jgi:hypothetical protein
MAVGEEGYASRAPLFFIIAICDGYHTKVSWGQGFKPSVSNDMSLHFT